MRAQNAAGRAAAACLRRLHRTGQMHEVEKGRKRTKAEKHNRQLKTEKQRAQPADPA